MAKIVAIYGGSGFVGRYVAKEMAKRGWRVRVAVRRPNEALFVRTYGAVGQVEAVPCNIRDDMSVRAAMSDADAVVNCVGIMVEEGKNRFGAVQTDGAERIARLSAEMGVARMVHISALGADADSLSLYASSKGRGEEAVLRHRPDAVILRPSVIFGPEDKFYNRFAAMSVTGPVMPVPGANTKMQPVYVEDVALAAVKGAEASAEPGIYELGGPELVTVREIVEETLKIIERRRLLIGMPFWAAGVLGSACDLVQTLTGGLLTNRLLTRDQVRLLAVDNVVSKDARGFADLGIQPAAPDAVIPEYLWRFRKSGQFAAIKASAKNLRQS